MLRQCETHVYSGMKNTVDLLQIGSRDHVMKMAAKRPSGY